MVFRITPNVEVQRDPQGVIRQLEHLREPYHAAEGEDALAVATRYLADVAEHYGLDGLQLERAAQRELMGTSVVSFVQMVKDIPVWQAGVSVTVQSQPLRVTSSYRTTHRDVKVRDVKPVITPEAIDERRLEAILGVRNLTINGTPRWRIYRFERACIHHPESLGRNASIPTIQTQGPLPKEGQHVLVVEVLFGQDTGRRRRLNWRVFLDAGTASVVYIRAFVSAACSGMVYDLDPPTKGNTTALPTSTTATLNLLRDTVTLPGLTPSDPQELTGQYVTILEIAGPADEPPTSPASPCTFHFDATSDDFMAVNAYYHLDRTYRLMADLGFDVPAYFPDTTFPIEADHRGESGINSHAWGNADETALDHYTFGLVQDSTPMASCVNWRTVLHEFCHHLLYARVDSANLGFSHSAGDSLNAVMNDPGTLTPDRGLTHQWTFPPLAPDGTDQRRRHDRTLADGWGWGGTKDSASYDQEQILSTTMFRLYRMLGGDSALAEPWKKETQTLAARLTTYLIIRAIGSLGPSPITPSNNATVFSDALMNADIGTTEIDGQRGGAFHKVVRWAFEQQALYRAPGVPATMPGAAPAVDVYINDGRNGEYGPYIDNFWETADIWNRLDDDAVEEHQEPILDVTNFVYVRIRNRGSETANDVVVKGFHCQPGAGLAWPEHWQAMTTAQLSPPGGTLAAGGSVVVGPFQWTPTELGHECLLMSVSATGDLSNIDTLFPCATGPTPDHRLVPFDNNIAQRNVHPDKGAGEFAETMKMQEMWVHNPFPDKAAIEVQIALPRFLSRKQWQPTFPRGDQRFILGRGESRKIAIGLRAGQPFTMAEARRAGSDTKVRVRAFANKELIGGITFPIATKSRVRKVIDKVQGKLKK